MTPQPGGGGTSRGVATLARIRGATARIAAAVDPTELLEELLPALLDIAAAEAAEIVVVEADVETKALIRVAIDVRPESGPHLPKHFGTGKIADPNAPPLPRARPLAPKVLKERRTVRGAEIPTGRAGAADPAPDPPCRAAIPMLAGRRILGYAYIERVPQRGEFTDEEILAVEILCDALAGYLRGAFPASP